MTQFQTVPRRFRAAFVFVLLCGGSPAPAAVDNAAGKGKPAQPASAPAKSGRQTKAEYACNPGPWGKLTYHYAYLEATETLMEFFPLPNTTPSWTLNREVLQEFPALLEKAGVPAEVRERMLEPQRVLRMNEVITLFPPEQDLEALTPEMRGVIYPVLARFPENSFHANPVFIMSGDVASWAKGTALRPEVIAKISRMIWKIGDGHVFSDVPSILGMAATDREARAIFKSFTRTRTLMLSLHVDKSTDVGQVSAYWTGGFKRKDILPLLESIHEEAAEGDLQLDICHLLSPLARKLLYSYPDLSLAANGRFPDCHWTSLNFFNPAPKNYYLNTRLAADAVMADYEKAEPPLRYGDVLLFMRDGDGVHSCVFVADDIVYTKNGENIVNPWMLMKLDDVKRIYAPDPAVVSIQAFRQKSPAR